MLVADSSATVSANLRCSCAAADPNIIMIMRGSSFARLKAKPKGSGNRRVMKAEFAGLSTAL
jgi:hypothetical protein